MPRNKSEKLPACLEAHVYADAAEVWLLSSIAEDTLPFYFWTEIPYVIRNKINDALAAACAGGGLRGGRRKRIAYIREHYAP